MDDLLFVLIRTEEYKVGKFGDDSMEKLIRGLSGLPKNTFEQPLNVFCLLSIFFWSRMSSRRLVTVLCFKICVQLSQENIYKIHEAENFMYVNKLKSKFGIFKPQHKQLR